MPELAENRTVLWMGDWRGKVLSAGDTDFLLTFGNGHKEERAISKGVQNSLRSNIIDYNTAV